jgi:hypothetical protein
MLHDGLAVLKDGLERRRPAGLDLPGLLLDAAASLFGPLGK